MSLINNIKIRFACNRIGTDEFGNSYYEEKLTSAVRGKKRRYVIYNGIPEASKVPPEWHLWLHYTSDIAPNSINTHKYAWQKIHLPNLTGTVNCFSPFVNRAEGPVRKKVSSDYHPWSPHIAGSAEPQGEALISTLSDDSSEIELQNSKLESK